MFTPARTSTLILPSTSSMSRNETKDPNKLVDGLPMDNLCATCCRLFDGSVDWSSRYTLQAHHHIISLSHSAAIGCHLCLLILRAVEYIEQPSKKYEWHDSLRDLVESNDYELWVSIRHKEWLGRNLWNSRLAIFPCKRGGNPHQTFMFAELPVSSILRQVQDRQLNIRF